MGAQHDAGDPSSDTVKSREHKRALARRHGINPKTVVKWRRRTSTSVHQPVEGDRARFSEIDAVHEQIERQHTKALVRRQW